MELTDTEKKTRRTKCPDCGKKIVIKDDHFTPDFSSMKIPGHNREKDELVVKPVAAPPIVQSDPPGGYCKKCNTGLTQENVSRLPDGNIVHVGCPSACSAEPPTPTRADRLISVWHQKQTLDPEEFGGEDYPPPEDYGPSPHDKYLEHYDRAPLPYQAPDALPGQLPIEQIVPPEVVHEEVRTGHTIEEVEAAGGYTVVLADPPWAYDQGGRGAAKNHYPTMTLEQIKALPVSRLAAKDAALFLWVTWPQMEVAFDVIRAWGFKFKTLGFSWVKYGESGKLQWGGGSWTRANEEVCLLATRGKPKRERADVHQLIEEWVPDEVLRAPRVEHSTKPAEARDRILKLMGEVPCIELFARGRAEGWDAWGLECPGGSDVIL